MQKESNDLKNKYFNLSKRIGEGQKLLQELIETKNAYDEQIAIVIEEIAKLKQEQNEVNYERK